MIEPLVDTESPRAWPRARRASGRPSDVPLRIGLVGTYPPRACGLATFTADVATSIRAAGDDVVVAALVDADDGHGEVPGAAYQLVQSSAESARSVAAALSIDVDAVLMEHEFGIFGGRRSVLHAFTDDLDVPYVLTLHTVAARFPEWQRAALAASLAGAALVFVFSEQAVGLLVDQFPGVAGRCRVVPHGSPAEMYRSRTPALRRDLRLPGDAKVISTFGLLSPSKGIEHAIRAMPLLRRAAGDVVYVVAGRTHPEVVRRHGERYRNQLMALCRALRVDDIVVFRNWFHDVDELSALLRTSDVFVTPYGDVEQIVSGALSFAVAAGLPFVSTPYRYATELAAAGCGVTVALGDDDGLAATLRSVLTDDAQRHRMARRASAVAATRSWPQVGQLISALCREAADRRWQGRAGGTMSDASSFTAQAGS